MKVAFLNPPFLRTYSRSQRSPAVTKSGTTYYPYWLCYAAGVLDEQGHAVQVIDAAPKNLSMEDIEIGLRKFVPDMCVIDTSTASIQNDVNIAEILKTWFPHCKIAMVGSHVTAKPEETLRMNPAAIDVIVKGEYDYAIRDLVNALNKGEAWQHIKSLCYLDDDMFYQNQNYPLIEDMDSLPMASVLYKKFLDVDDYYFAAADYPMIMMITGRGCPFKCFYCVYPQTMHGHTYRYRSPANVVAEFKYIDDNFPTVKEVVIEDDTFTVHPKRVRKICELMIEQKIKVKWSCNARAHLDLKTLTLMRKAGCRLLIVGYENGNQEMLDNMEKGLKVETAIKFAKDVRKAGLLTHGCFMLGNPGESMETIQNTYNFAKKVKCDSAQFYPIFVYPGTAAYKWAEDNKYLKTHKFSDWLDEDGRHNCVVDLPNFSGDDLTKISEELTFKYHMRLPFLLYKFTQLFTYPIEGLRSLRSGFKYFHRLFAHFLTKKPI